MSYFNIAYSVREKQSIMDKKRLIQIFYTSACLHSELLKQVQQKFQINKKRPKDYKIECLKLLPQ